MRVKKRIPAHLPFRVSNSNTQSGKNVKLGLGGGGAYLLVELLLEGGGKICGHLSNGIAGGVADPRVLRRRRRVLA